MEPAVQEVMGDFPGCEVAGHEADQSPPSSADFKNVCVELYLHFSIMSLLYAQGLLSM
jgi:hypothetical protein